MAYRSPILALALAVAACPIASAHPHAVNGAAGEAPPPHPAAAQPLGPPITAKAVTAPGTQPPAAAAAPTSDLRRYFVEIIIFRARIALGSPEDWQAETGMATTVTGGEAPSGSGVGQLIEVLPASSYHLTPIAQVLRGSHAYTPLAHAAWDQTASAWGTHAGFTLKQLGIDVPGLTGQVTLERGQYLHLGMTLDYREPHPPAGLGAAPGTTFVLNETRRVRYYRRNYYDNPAFGVIALVLPVRGSQPPGR